ncbi:DUF5753 domain-containing protein [Streptomyces millisiae]|uniref:DUF5753 domain-containing protein n=1 Tax=Streptomyces millisiae TaxID=3075542 RepID=A0ABU2LKW6_9ACTN|nr:DUF5753 domain-containing protein [Streptomyces sp. DSM 44918]MDT0318225.1 DUF5753 domain-containing protein [Streptomyces sp. DSM 44918]
MSRVEAGKLPPRPSERFTTGCDTAFGTGSLFADLLRRIDDGDHPSWFSPYLDLERKASRILDYSSNLVMGVLQTEDYARATFQVARPTPEAESVAGKVAARLRRREVFDRPAPPLLWVILHESCLRTVVGSPKILAGQLNHLLTAGTSPYIQLQVLPFALLYFTGSPTVLYTETRVGGRMHDSAETVASALDDYDLLRAHALSPDRSLAMIERLLKELR